MKEERISLFKPFKDMNQGFEKMLDIAESIKNDNETKIQLIICYGCLIETFNIHNRNIREECDDIDALMREKISESNEEFVQVKDEFIMKKGGES